MADGADDTGNFIFTQYIWKRFLLPWPDNVFRNNIFIPENSVKLFDGIDELILRGIGFNGSMYHKSGDSWFAMY